MTETAHTPLPWVANDKHSGANPWRIENDEGVYANGGWIIAECMGPDAKANAAFIVQAVNSHHRLVEALEKARKIIADIDDYMKRPSRGDWGEECACCMGELLDDDRDAIAKIDAALKEAGR